MDPNRFAELCESVQEATLIVQGKLSPPEFALRRLQEIAEVHQKKNEGLSEEIEAAVLAEVKQLRQR